MNSSFKLYGILFLIVSLAGQISLCIAQISVGMEYERTYREVNPLLTSSTLRYNPPSGSLRVTEAATKPTKELTSSTLRYNPPSGSLRVTEAATKPTKELTSSSSEAATKKRSLGSIQSAQRITQGDIHAGDTEGSEISVFSSFLKSAVIPGWGELRTGNKSGYVFLASEVLLWSSRLYFLEEVKLREEEAYVYAMKYAGLQPGKYSNDYFNLLSRYNSSGFEAGGYNEMVLIRAQTLYPNDTEAQNQYILDNAILDQSLYWDWDNRENRRQYSIMRKNADHNRDYAKAVIGIIVANHVISAINAVRITSNMNRRNRIQVGLDFHRKDIIPLVKASYRF